MALSEDLVGSRVVVRHVVRGELGPSGGPAMTDLLGILEEWSSDSLAVTLADGTVATVDQADVVAAKPVPPRPMRRRPC